MGRRRDAALTVLVAIPVGIAIAVLRPPVTLEPVLVGVVGTVVLEAVLLSQRTRVRTLWDSWAIQTLAVLTTLAVVAIAVTTVGSTVLLVVWSGLVTYLVLLVVAELRDHQTRW